MVYRRYEGASLADLERIVDEDVTATMLSRLAPRAVRAIREHRAAGHRLVLVTGAVTPLTRPIAALFDEVIGRRAVRRRRRSLHRPPRAATARR